MRVISGKKKGKKLELLKSDTVRPTTDKVKESIFNVIQFDIVGANFLDLFAGSGQIGIEALSRGAKNVTFVDKNRNSINVIKKNLFVTDFLKDSKIINIDALVFLQSQHNYFDIAFLDPPYNTDLLEKSLSMIENVMSKNGIIICEHNIEKFLPNEVANFTLFKIYKYGKIAVSIYMNTNLIW